jgi:hypothetical protein
LLALLTERTHSIPLAKLKETLGAKAAEVNVEADSSVTSVGGGPNVKAIYACVAKKAIKIERGGREQLVRFDI